LGLPKARRLAANGLAKKLGARTLNFEPQKATVPKILKTWLRPGFFFALKRWPYSWAEKGIKVGEKKIDKVKKPG
jgi:hypothetical protein